MRWLLDRVREQSFAKGEVIILEGDPCPGLFVVRSGAVKLYRSSTEGEEQIVRIVRSGGCFECAPIFDRGPNPVSAQALEPTTVYITPASAFESLVDTHPQVALHVARILAMRLRSLLNMVEDFSFKRVFSRVSKLLLQMGEREGQAPTVSPAYPVSQQHLACIVGCSRQVVNSCLRKLVKDGIIRMEGRRIIVVKPDRLNELVYPEIARKRPLDQSNRT
ncbi:MAG: Crp/Fnr family transcriptional regulator [Chloroflexi bacterium]|nr:Crp/Fnr family transcriptional regulator [Chloroflexota bacterium]